MADFIDTRSFLASNVDNLLENLSIRRNASKNEAEDLFGDSTDKKEEMNWNLGYAQKSKIEILLQEKESLGLYVSGHPLDEYKELMLWCREATARDDIYVVLIDKIRKIFTKTNSMMFALQISVPDIEVEGIIFPKNALHLSPILEEKELYWVKGKIQQSKKAAASKSQKKETDGDSEEPEDAPVEGEMKEYDELPKLIIDELVKFEEGIVPLFAHEDIPLAANRLNTIKTVNWKALKERPSAPQSGEKHEHNSKDKNFENNENNIEIIFLPKSLGASKLKAVKEELRPQKFTGSIEVKVEVESSEGVKKVKGTFWTTPETLMIYRKI